MAIGSPLIRENLVLEQSSEGFICHVSVLKFSNFGGTLLSILAKKGMMDPIHKVNFVY